MRSTFRYDTHAGNAADAFGAPEVFTDPITGAQGITRILEMNVEDARAIIQLSYDGVIFGDDIELDQDDPPIQLPHAARSFQIRNALAGAISRYQIIGFW